MEEKIKEEKRARKTTSYLTQFWVPSCTHVCVKKEGGGGGQATMSWLSPPEHTPEGIVKAIPFRSLNFLCYLSAGGGFPRFWVYFLFLFGKTGWHCSACSTDRVVRMLKWQKDTKKTRLWSDRNKAETIQRLD